MASRDQLESALVAAHNAGNEDDARTLATALATMPKPTVPDQASPVVKEPTEDKSIFRQIGESFSRATPFTQGGSEASLQTAVPQNSAEAKGVQDASQGAMAAAARYGLPLAGSAGGVPGAAAAGGGEGLAQLIEGGKISDPGAVGQASVLGAVPFSKAKGILGAADNALRMGAGSAAATQARSLINEGAPATAADTGKGALLASAIPVAAPLAGRVAGKVLNTVLPDAEGAALAAERDAPRMATFKAAQEAGYVVPPSAVNDSGINKRLESVAGKAAVGQQAAGLNQKLTNELAKSDLPGFTEEALTPDALDSYRSKVAEPYRQIEQMAETAKSDLANLKKEKLTGTDAHELAIQTADPETAAKMKSLSTQAAADVDALKKARNVAKTNYDFSYRTGNPEALEKARAADQHASDLEDKIEKAAEDMGNPKLADDLRASRRLIAKSYSIEQSLNPATGDVSAPMLGRLVKQGKPLDGNLKIIGDFALAFPSYAREGAKIPTPGVSKIEAASMLLGGVSGVSATHSPYGALVGAAPLVSGPVRSMVLSKPYQNAFAKITPKVEGLTVPTDTVVREAELAEAKKRDAK